MPLSTKQELVPASCFASSRSVNRQSNVGQAWALSCLQFPTASPAEQRACSLPVCHRIQLPFNSLQTNSHPSSHIVKIPSHGSSASWKKRDLHSGPGLNAPCRVHSLLTPAPGRCYLYDPSAQPVRKSSQYTHYTQPLVVATALPRKY
jgi:hypothetical protein